jgi:dihydropteroate synthase
VAPKWRVLGQVLGGGNRTLIMGVLNITPDSFSDGGRYSGPGEAISRGLQMVADGADIVDVGGESTRPGAQPVDDAEERRRVLPVVRALADAGVVVSIDTCKAAVAAAALEAGAAIVNDVTALGDREMAGLVAGSGAGVVLMHMQGNPRTMQADPRYDDVAADVRSFLLGRAEEARSAGISADRICLDPGIGFGKRLQHNLALLRAIPNLAAEGYPVLVGVSRKSFIEGILGPLAPDDRDQASAAAQVLAIAGGASVLRLHNVVVGLQTARIADAIVRGF